MKFMSYFKIILFVILCIHLYHFVLKYNIYTLICKLPTVLKFGWLLLRILNPFSCRLYQYIIAILVAATETARTVAASP